MRQLQFPRLCLINMRGKIIKGIAGFYYVQVQDKVYECKAKGIFRYKNEKPLVGDNVEIEVLNEQEATGTITRIEERNNSLIRPEVANIDQALIVFAAKSPAPNLNLLDRFLVMMEIQDIPCLIAFSKSDLAEEHEVRKLCDIYEKAGYTCFAISTLEDINIDRIKSVLAGKTTAFAGPSGVRKIDTVKSSGTGMRIWRSAVSAGRLNVGNIPPDILKSSVPEKIPICLILPDSVPCILPILKKII